MYIDAIEKLASADIRNIDTDSLIDAGDMSLDKYTAGKSCAVFGPTIRESILLQGRQHSGKT